MSAAEPASRVEQANERAVRANGRGSGPVLQSGFLVILTHSAIMNESILPFSSDAEPVSRFLTSFAVIFKKGDG